LTGRVFAGQLPFTRYGDVNRDLAGGHVGAKHTIDLV